MLLTRGKSAFPESGCDIEKVWGIIIMVRYVIYTYKYIVSKN